MSEPDRSAVPDQEPDQLQHQVPDEVPDREPVEEQYQEPTPEQLAERAVRANKATRGALAGILGLEAVVTLLVPRAIAFTTGLGLTRTLILVGLAVLMVAAAGMVRRPFGIGVGSGLQVLFVLTGILLPAMFVVGVIFAAIWGYLLSLRHELVGTPGGWRLLVS